MVIEKNENAGVAILKIIEYSEPARGNPYIVFEEVKNVFAQGFHSIIVDLSEVGTHGSSAVGELVASYNFTRTHFGQFRVCGAEKVLADKLRTMKLDEILGQPDAAKEDVIAQLSSR